MICTPCKTAGEFLARGRPFIASAYHQHCEHPATCPCQHKTSEEE